MTDHDTDPDPTEEDRDAVTVEIDETLRYEGDICERFSFALWPAVEDLGVENPDSIELTDAVRVTGELTLEVDDD